MMRRSSGTYSVATGSATWPYSYYGPHLDNRVRPQRPDLVAAAIKPDYALSSHVAALGLVFTHGSALPEAYASGAFVGQRGSWNREEFNGYKVSYVPFRDGKPDGMAQDVVTGFLLADQEQVRGRPVGLGIDGTGALLIADDAGNTVWRVAAADWRVTDAPVETDRVTGARAGAVSPLPPADESLQPAQDNPSATDPPAPPVRSDPAPVPQPGDAD